jgi:3-isopropylmalate/(R)-2-methylmalate dehydratase small subunit
MKIIESNYISLARKDIDTDLIIPAKFLTTTEKSGLGQHVFSNLRAMDKNFPFNLPEFADCKILVARDNFGCGSSREHAAWALKDWGIEVIIAPSFADIFFTNAQKNGILPVILPREIVEGLLVEAKDPQKITVDLPEQKVKIANEEYNFEIDPYRKECLIKEMDDLDYLISQISSIKKIDQKRKEKLFINIDNIKL